MRFRPSRVMPLSLALVLGLLAAPPVAFADANPDAPARAEQGAEVLLQLKIKRKGKTLKHPGHMVPTDSEFALTIKDGDRNHEVTVTLGTGKDGSFPVKLAYRDNGKPVLSGTLNAQTKQWVTLKSKNGKTTISVRIDPDKKRSDGVELPDSDDPLDGV